MRSKYTSTTCGASWARISFARYAAWATWCRRKRNDVRPHGGRSLRTRLLLLLLGSISIGLLAVGIGVFASAQHEIDELFDAQLAQSARTLLELPLGPGGSQPSPSSMLHEYERKVAYLVRNASGEVVRRSHFADLASVPLDCAGLGEQRIAGDDWRIVCVFDPAQALHVAVGQQLDIRRELRVQIVGAQFLPLLLALPVIGFLAYVAVGRGLAPLRTLSSEIAARSPRDLQPVPISDVPAEIQPLVAELNCLFQRVLKTLEEEKRFTADAAHELRTPLAALRTQAEVALKSMPDGSAGRGAAQKVIASVDRAKHLVDQLLTLARVDHVHECDRNMVALYPLAQETIGCVIEAFPEKPVEISLEGDPRASALGDESLLRVALRNLVDNAVRYAPSGGEVHVRVLPGLIEVNDSGPGIAPDLRDRVLQRFFRGEGAAATGSGLGLSIAARVADLHGAVLKLGEGRDGRGLLCRIELVPGPLAQDQPSHSPIRQTDRALPAKRLGAG